MNKFHLSSAELARATVADGWWLKRLSFEGGTGMASGDLSGGAHLNVGANLAADPQRRIFMPSLDVSSFGKGEVYQTHALLDLRYGIKPGPFSVYGDWFAGLKHAQFEFGAGLGANLCFKGFCAFATVRELGDVATQAFSGQVLAGFAFDGARIVQDARERLDMGE